MPAMPIDLTDQKVFVLGAGVSGLAAARLLRHIGAIPIVVEDEDAARAKASDIADSVLTMAEAEDALSEAALVVTSPGIPPHLLFLPAIPQLMCRYGGM